MNNTTPPMVPAMIGMDDPLPELLLVEVPNSRFINIIPYFTTTLILSCKVWFCDQQICSYVAMCISTQ